MEGVYGAPLKRQRGVNLRCTKVRCLPPLVMVKVYEAVSRVWSDWVLGFLLRM